MCEEYRGSELEAAHRRIAELEALAVAMQRAVPGGSVVDTQWMADELRRLATEAGVTIPD